MNGILPETSSSEDGSSFDSSSSDVDVEVVNDDPIVSPPSATLACNSNSGADGSKDTALATQPKEAAPSATHTSPQNEVWKCGSGGGLVSPSACSSHSCSRSHLPYHRHRLCKNKVGPQAGEMPFNVGPQTNPKSFNIGPQPGIRPCNFGPQTGEIHCKVGPRAVKRTCSFGRHAGKKPCNFGPKRDERPCDCIDSRTSYDTRKQCLTGTTYKDFGCQFPEIPKEDYSKLKDLLSGIKSFVCSECGQRFGLEHHYKKHIQNFSNQSLENGYKCMLCSHVFKTKCARKHHHLIHQKSPSDYSTSNICNECGLKFSKQSKLRAHEKAFTVDSEKRIFKCYFCRHAFTSEMSRNRHEGVHGKDRRLPCCCCDSLFPNRYSLKLHARSRDIKFPPQCLDCGWVFAEEDYLEDHLRQVKKDLPYECYVCHHKFQTKLALTRHVNLHSKNREYECPSCLGRFVSVNLLNQHQLISRRKVNSKGKIIK